MKKLGLIINSIAGMGGAVGLKGTDGKEIQEKAKKLGAKKVAPKRAELFLSFLKPAKTEILVITAAGTMGATEAQAMGFEYNVVGHARDETSALDTVNAAKEMHKEGVDLLVFCGGDGTARNVMDAVSTRVPVLGVPTGVKMHSAVFAYNPESAASTAYRFLFGGLPLREAEVMDVDEEAFRNGRVSAKLYGYVTTPYEPNLVQSMKVASPMTEEELRNQAAIAVYFIDKVMAPGITYIVGPGTTTRTITDLLEQKKTRLGVDLLCNRKIIAHDMNEKEILEIIQNKKAKIVVTPIGGQGFIFGRGNQQISPAVIRHVGTDNIIVVATKSKLSQQKSLRVDTGDSLLDEEIRGKIDVIVDYEEQYSIPIK